MKAFAYVKAAGEKQAIAALAAPGGKALPLAGGMDLIGLMKDYVAQPDRLVSVKELDASITKSPNGGLRIGSAVTLADLAANADARRLYPALTDAAAEVGTPQIRNAGTVGGNLNQRPRCWYFRNEEFNCLKKSGSRCFAVDGENKYHAIFGEGPCHIVHPSSLAVPAIALDARFRIVGPGGEREVAAAEYYQMPDKNLYGETILGPSDLLTHVILPPPGQTRNATYEVRFKQSHDWPLAMASVALSVQGQNVRAARIVMGSVAPVPWRSPAAETVLVGKRLTEQAAMEAADAAVAAAKPMSQNAYKVQIARTAVKRAILKAAGMKVV
ncbi:MAG: FAD binding domain-containing protein [Vicinamibacterales bacterium]